MCHFEISWSLSKIKKKHNANGSEVNGVFPPKVHFPNFKRKQIWDWVLPARRKNSIKDQKKVTPLCVSQCCSQETNFCFWSILIFPILKLPLVLTRRLLKQKTSWAGRSLKGQDLEQVAINRSITSVPQAFKTHTKKSNLSPINVKCTFFSQGIWFIRNVW